jgi:hypothetical protein
MCRGPEGDIRNLPIRTSLMPNVAIREEWIIGNGVRLKVSWLDWAVKKLLCVVSCRKGERCLVVNYCKIVWAIKRSNFRIMSSLHSLKFDLVLIIFPQKLLWIFKKFKLKIENAILSKFKSYMCKWSNFWEISSLKALKFTIVFIVFF